MARIDVYLKVEAELDENDEPGKFAAEICRQIAKVYGVRSAEMTNFIVNSED